MPPARGGRAGPPDPATSASLEVLAHLRPGRARLALQPAAFARDRVASFQPFASACIATPDDFDFTSTSTQCPATDRPE
ncbi:hypothetical protein DV20_40360 [Amycolatopsis rifamycinica]|uniref:Uncharacterized protein n=1 Tax=Amycolatopsis rifamycinica TaxID=287986 RepID=A0A066TPL4_9PSEU|nr:hypothetical protein DV20_40360 [Amycolatopsis rifamycinica]